MYLYETHLHTAPMSGCAKVGIRETLEYYQSAGYAGVFLTNHFWMGTLTRSFASSPTPSRSSVILPALRRQKGSARRLA